MRRQLILLGALALGSGVGMNLMLGQLRSDFFRAYLPPWMYASYAVIGLGAALVVIGGALKPVQWQTLSPARAAGYMVKLALLNATAAVLMVAPVLMPSLRLPILITQWPGIYMVLAYFSFLAVGVLGMAAWSVLYAHLPDLLGRSAIGKLGFGVHVFMTEIGVYALAISMFAGGYVGSWLAYTGAGPVAVGAQMEFSVIPSAFAIFLVAAGTFIGVVNLVASRRSVQV